MTDAPQTVADGAVVLFRYTLKNDAGEVLDEAPADDPMPYLHGAGNIVPGLERALTGKKVGDAFDVEVAPKDGYGERTGTTPQPLPRSGFPADVELRPGMSFAAQLEDGQYVMLWVTEVQEDVVLVDPTHPLAGETLHFSVEIMGLREATDEEKAHGHPHGPEGHDHH
jgi:FKBP-type peptidyl-prolyl cis-trans isomerase SlyD